MPPRGLTVRIRELEAENAQLKRELAKGGDRVYAPDGLTWQEMAYAEAAKRGPLQDENARLAEQLADATRDLLAADEENEALEEKLRSLAPHGSCACSYDQPGDVCMHHSPKLSALCDAAQAVVSYDGSEDKPPFVNLLLALEAEISRSRSPAPVPTAREEG
jgi:hypothetical protein